FGDSAGDSAGFGRDWLLYGGLATLAFGAIGLLASQNLGRMAGFSVIVSSGTLLAAIGFARPDVTAAALYYLLVSSLAVAGLFLLTELVERSRGFGDDLLALTQELFAVNLSAREAEQEEVGVIIPAAMA